ncbi:MAG: hypothetical protein JSS07_12805 [Proteobacteria bacterium]|nr:hypothetical protein [Pseudomonadota bacterium]
MQPPSAAAGRAPHLSPIARTSAADDSYADFVYDAETDHLVSGDMTGLDDESIV